VVSFGSAPGVPNWGGLLPRVRKEAQEPAHECFDVMYVVDAERSWYSGASGCLSVDRRAHIICNVTLRPSLPTCHAPHSISAVEAGRRFSICTGSAL
jgi:hypothetical protein